jgi:hypothetical protein
VLPRLRPSAVDFPCLSFSALKLMGTGGYLSTRPRCRLLDHASIRYPSIARLNATHRLLDYTLPIDCSIKRYPSIARLYATHRLLDYTLPIDCSIIRYPSIARSRYPYRTVAIGVCQSPTRFFAAIESYRSDRGLSVPHTLFHRYRTVP